MLSTFSYACLSFVYHLWRNVYSSPWPTFYSIYFCYSWSCSSFIFWILIPYQIYNLQISSPTPYIAFHSIDCVLWCTEKQFDVVWFIYFFALVSCDFIVIFKKLPHPVLWSFSHMFSSRSFMFWGLLFQSLIHFEIILTYSKSPASSFGMWIYSFPASFVEETLFFPFNDLGTLSRDQLT